MMRRVSASFYPLAALIGAIIIWYAAVVVFNVPKYILPLPGDVYDRIREDFSFLLWHSFVTTGETLGGFALSIGRDGSMTPIASGLRSPAGVATAPWGDVFFTDNQGEWCGASKLGRITPGSFHGHPYGIESTRRPEYAWGFPGDPPEGVLMPLVPERVPAFALPAVWFPYDKTGRSPSGLGAK